MAILNGTDLALYVASAKIAHAQDCSIEIPDDMIDVTTKDSGGWKDIIPGTRSGTISASLLYEDGASNHLDTIYSGISGRAVAIARFSSVTSGQQRWSASTYVSSLSMNAGTEDGVSWSVTLEITDSITQAAAP